MDSGSAPLTRLVQNDGVYACRTANLSQACRLRRVDRFQHAARRLMADLAGLADHAGILTDDDRLGEIAGFVVVAGGWPAGSRAACRTGGFGGYSADPDAIRQVRPDLWHRARPRNAALPPALGRCGHILRLADMAFEENRAKVRAGRGGSPVWRRRSSPPAPAGRRTDDRGSLRSFEARPGREALSRALGCGQPVLRYLIAQRDRPVEAGFAQETLQRPPHPPGLHRPSQQGAERDRQHRIERDVADEDLRQISFWRGLRRDLRDAGHDRTLSRRRRAAWFPSACHRRRA